MDKFLELKEQFEEERKMYMVALKTAKQERKALVKYLQVKEQDLTEVGEVKEVDSRIAKYKKVIKVYDRIFNVIANKISSTCVQIIINY